MRIRQRLLAVLAIPTLALAVFSGTRVREDGHEMHEAKRVAQAADLAADVSAFVHESQKERGRTAVHLNSADDSGAAALREQRARTDAARQALRARLAASSDLRLGAAIVARAMDDSAKAIDAIDALRADVDARRTAAGVAVERYTEVHDTLTHALAAIADDVHDPELGRNFRALVAAMRATDCAGLERAKLAGILAKGGFAEGDLARYAGLVAAQQAWFAQFAESADPTLAAKLDDIERGPEANAVRRWRGAAMLGRSDGEAQAWFADSTRLIDRYADLEENAVDRLSDGAATLRAAAGKGLWVDLAIAGGAIAIFGGIGFSTMRRIGGAVDRVLAGVHRVQAERDLSLRLDDRGDDELSEIAHGVNGLLETVREILLECRTSMVQIGAGSEQVSAASQDLAQGAAEQAGTLQTIAIEAEQVADAARGAAEQVAEVNRISGGAQASADRGRREMSELTSAMEEINQSSRDVAAVIRVIDDIAFQTNLLALNAAVEAARAGEAGKGFAVVAEEVRNLAQRSAEAARETNALIDRSVERVHRGVEISGRVAGALSEIADGATSVNGLLQTVAGKVEEQSRRVASINGGLAQLDQVTQRAASNSEELAASAEEAMAQVRALEQVVGRFRLDAAHGRASDAGSSRASGRPGVGLLKKAPGGGARAAGTGNREAAATHAGPSGEPSTPAAESPATFAKATPSKATPAKATPTKATAKDTGASAFGKTGAAKTSTPARTFGSAAKASPVPAKAASPKKGTTAVAPPPEIHPDDEFPLDDDDFEPF